MERKALIFNVQKYNMYDGPGIRTIVFFKGCPLRCKWCANPEGLERKIQIMFKKNSCVNCGLCVDACPVGIHEITPEGIHRVRRDIDCTGCGKCKSVCPQAALEVNGQVKTVSELLEIVEEDAAFYSMSGRRRYPGRRRMYGTAGSCQGAPYGLQEPGNQYGH